MSEAAAKADLLRYLQEAREALLWKLDGLSEYEMRRPRTPTGTNLLGLVKHVASVEIGYFGDTFGRPFEDTVPHWMAPDAELNADMWADADESRADIEALYRRAWAHSNATIGELPLDAVGRVPWWNPENAEVTLHHIAVRVLADTQRHAGHADILRELQDGSAGWLPGKDALATSDPDWWAAYRDRVEDAARQAEENETGGKPQ